MLKVAAVGWRVRPADDTLPWPHPWWFRVALRAMWCVGELGLGARVFRGLMWLRRPFIGRIQATSFEGYAPTGTDVLVCTHPKSGTNWLLQICVQIADRGAARFDHIHHVVPWPDCPLPTLPITLATPPSSTTGLRVIKTHLDAPLVPQNPDARYIVVLRDPRDTLVSSFHFIHTCLQGIFDVQLTMAEWLQMHVDGLTPFDSWASHTASWWARRDDDNVLILRFEELAHDLEGAVERIAEHLGVALTPDERADVVRQSTFSYMREHNAQFAPPFRPIRGGEMCMIREGVVGGFGALLTPDQSCRLMDHTRAELERLGSDFPLDATYPSAP